MAMVSGLQTHARKDPSWDKGKVGDLPADAFRRLWENGTSIHDICVNAGITPKAAHAAAERLFLGSRRKDPAGVWRDPRNLEKLKAMWADGKTGAEIAAVIPGSTRVGVIAKANRLGLKQGIKLPKQKAERPYLPRARRPRQNSKAVKRGIGKPGDRPQFGPPTEFLQADAASEPAAPEVIAEIPPFLIDGAAATVMTIKDSMCRWPIGDPASPSFHFCGNTVAAKGLSYCLGHCHAAYLPGSSKPTRKREPRSETERQVQLKQSWLDASWR